MTSPAVEVSGLHYRYPDGREALRGLDLRIEARERIALLGPNGAGKTTLALHLNGVLEAASGMVHIGDLTLDESTVSEIRRRVGVVFQNTDDQLFMPTVRQDVAFGPANLGLEGEALLAATDGALRAVDAIDIAERPPHHLSGGERRRAALATVLSMEPDVLVLDEPSSALDPGGRREILDVLRTLEMTQIVITHDLPFALESADRAAIIAGGRVVADGAITDVLSDEDLLRKHNLELPYAFDRAVLRRDSPAG